LTKYRELLKKYELYFLVKYDYHYDKKLIEEKIKMRYLFIAIVIWGFAYNFSSNISAVVDNDFIALSRIFFATLLFLPFTKFIGLKKEFIVGLLYIGAIEVGAQYMFYYRIYDHISVAEALLFFATMPIFTTIFDDMFRKVVRPISFITAFIAIFAAVVIRWNEISESFLIGMILVQLVNVTHSFGMIWYKYHTIKYSCEDVPDHKIFFYLMSGGLIASSIIFMILGDPSDLPENNSEWGMIVYLGVIVTGLSYVLLNKGAKMVSGATTGIFQNLSIPVGMLITFLFFDTGSIDPITATITMIIMGIAVYINEKYSEKIIIDFSKKMTPVI